MKKEEMISLVKHLNIIFDTVRIVDLRSMNQYVYIDKEGLKKETECCYEIWEKEKKCDNCIATKALVQKTKVSKFEFVDDDIYYVTAMYIEVEDTPLVLETVLHITYEISFDAYGQNELVQSILNTNKKIYEDALTGAYNRHFYEDQLVGLYDDFSLVVVDADDFKNINDTYGHEAGDIALRSIVQTIQFFIRSNDLVIRYGGDEFVIVFRSIPKDIFMIKLEKIRKAISELVIEKYPTMHITVSMGGVSEEGKVEDLFNKADYLLYQAKKEKNKVLIQ